MQTYRLLLLFVTSLAGFASCTSEPASTSAVAPPQTPVRGEPGTGDTILPPPDQSLNSDEYLKEAVPFHGRIWNGEDMKWAATVLESMEEKSRGRLPRFQSPNSGEVFARLVADDNLDLYRNTSAPLPQRFPDAIEFMQSSNQVLKLYLAARNRQEVGDSELVEFLGLQLRITVAMIQLVDEFVPTLDQSDPTYPTRMAGLQRMKGGMATIVEGVLTTLTESSAYRVSERKRLAGYLETALPKILPAISETARTEVLSRLRSLLANSDMQELKPDLEKVLRAVSPAEAQ